MQELSKEYVAKKLQRAIGKAPNYNQLERTTQIGRHIIKAMYTGEKDYYASNLYKLCNELKIDLLK